MSINAVKGVEVGAGRQPRLEILRGGDRVVVEADHPARLEAGIELLGDIPLNAGSLQYILFFSNGRGDSPSRVQEFSDQNSDG